MRFPNADKGIRRICQGGILMIAAAALSIGVLILLAVNRIDLGSLGEGGRRKLFSTPMLVPFALYSVGTVALLVISFLLSLAGIIQARRDIPGFGTALWALLLGILLAVVSLFVRRSNRQLVYWLNIVSTFSTMAVALSVVSGISRLAGTLGSREIVEACGSAQRLLHTTFLLSALAELIVAVCYSNDIMALFLGVFSHLLRYVIYLLDILSYAFYLRVLVKARSMQEPAAEKRRDGR